MPKEFRIMNESVYTTVVVVGRSFFKGITFVKVTVGESEEISHLTLSSFTVRGFDPQPGQIFHVAVDPVIRGINQKLLDS